MARDLRLFYLFRLLATSYLYVPIFMLFMEDRGLSFSQRMLLGGIYSAVVLMVELPTGVFADRLGRRRSMMLGAVTMVVSCLVAYRSHSFGMFAIAEVLAAISMSLCSGADSAYLFDLLAENGAAHEYSRRESTASAWHLFGSAVAFAGGGYLAEIDLALPYLVTAGVSTLAVFVAAGLRDDRPGVQLMSRPPVSAVWREWRRHMRESLTDIHDSHRLRWMIAYSAVVFVLLRATVYLYQPYLKARGFDAAAIGLVFAGVYVLASLVAHRAYQIRARLGDDTLLWAVLGLLATSFALLEPLRGAWVLILLGVQAFAMGLYSPLVKPLINRDVPDSSRRATILSVESVARRGAMGVFAPIAGVYGETSALYLCGFIGLGGLIVLAGMAARSGQPVTRSGDAAAE